MTSLLTNNAAMTALTTLKSINTQLDMTSNRVSTGQRVSSAADNAAYWSIATTVRTDNASLGAVKDSLGLGSSAVDTAYNGLNSAISDLQNMRAKLQTALQPGVDRAKVQVEIDAIQNKMDSTAKSSVSSGQNWLSVDSSASTYQKDRLVIAGFSREADGDIAFSTVKINVNEIKLYDANAGTSVDVPGTAAQVFGSQTMTGLAAFRPADATPANRGTADFSGAATVALDIRVDGSATAAVITLNKASLTSAVSNLARVTTDELLSAINNQIAGSVDLAGKVTAGLDTQGRLTFTRSTVGSPESLQVNTTAANTVDLGYGGATATGKLATGTDATTVVSKGILDTAGGTYTTPGVTGNYTVADFDISKLVGTAGDADLSSIINMVDKAIAKVTDAGTKLGANKTQIDGQKSFIDTLMKANDRTIGTLVDADIEEESTKLKALQTQQQLGVQALSIANAASQNVLSLFR
ncbi:MULTISPECIES: flagellin [unclassified Methylobacterium]|uniref:flagellin N-terminal helical domain-containing protein n=1 Tax=unclassified Methylobacterium TaxID=2615210 RepID=UPI0006F786DF|nr:MULTISPECIES: flagellin [unclassified Methylobacterium]KQO66238.1 flagellin [Methylobacterium sp. Leaf89]KQO72481.1 flagellin [Methylobacterium sp. Leaf88]KQP70920.1 flagellin [Methylobacterium sp. Leaf111]KQT81983.1 flagellin [Methylobacterium sp. Leaf465]